MSVGVGVSDIVFFVNQTLILFGKCKDAPAELQAAGRDVEQMRAALEILGEATSKKDSLVAKQPAVALMIKHEIKPLKEDLTAMNVILTDYIDKSKNMSALGRVRYAVLDRNKLQTIQSHLTKSRTNLALMLDLISLKAHEQHDVTSRAGMRKLEAILTKQSIEADARRAEAKARERGDGKLDQIFKLLQDRHPTNARQQDDLISPSQMLDHLKERLRGLGLSKDKAKAARLSAAQALSDASNPSSNPPLRDPKPRMGSVGEAPDRPKMPGSATKKPSSTPNIDLRAKHGASLAAKTKGYRILCVDDTHGVQAVLAQTYLEVLRLWTANNTGRWLFQQVHSAGAKLNRTANSPIGAIAEQASLELLPPGDYLWAKDYPHETQSIARRMKAYGKRAFSVSDTAKYEVILCFTTKTASWIRDAASGKQPRILVLPGCGHIESKDCIEDPKKIPELISAIKVSVKNFISDELGDWTIDLKRTVNYRTLQAVLPSKDPVIANRVSTKDIADFREYEKKTGCAIRSTGFWGTPNGFLISITGPKDSLMNAVKLVRTSHLCQSSGGNLLQ